MRILVGIDGSPGSEAALRWACHEATLRPAAISALVAWTADGRPQRVYHLARRAPRRTPTAGGRPVWPLPPTPVDPSLRGEAEPAAVSRPWSPRNVRE
ncbi:universal stress protein [Pseudofrankia sp. BMG5.37]|nr:MULTISPECIES: universal stress protein [unclassified Pseudofrankia]MDT3445461.1 universal stress protein [Pseudofrankia sp. BMG5.37]